WIEFDAILLSDMGILDNEPRQTIQTDGRERKRNFFERLRVKQARQQDREDDNEKSDLTAGLQRQVRRKIKRAFHLGYSPLRDGPCLIYSLYHCQCGFVAFCSYTT